MLQYPEMIFRPGNSHEEAPDLQQPISFSNCARPVVLYLNHLFMFGDFWVRTMPTLLNALHSPDGAWDTDYTIVVATGGQRLQVGLCCSVLSCLAELRKKKHFFVAVLCAAVNGRHTSSSSLP